MYVKMLLDTTEDVRRHEGRYPFVSISQFSVHGFWGTGALSSISERLQKKLPGLRGFSERNLKYMRTFYEEWSPLLEFTYEDSAEASAETAAADAIEIRQKLLPNSVSVPSEHFLNIGFSHHCQILTSVKDVEERLYYVEACAREHMSLERLRRAIRNDNYHHQGTLPNNFTQALPSPQQALRAIETFKDEYLLDFINVEEIGVRDVGDVDERVVEQAIVRTSLWSSGGVSRSSATLTILKLSARTSSSTCYSSTAASTASLLSSSSVASSRLARPP